MCGLIAEFSRGLQAIPSAAVEKGLLHMVRRGPDGEGIWAEEGAVLGHRRLAIIDLDVRAAQPMISYCGRYVIVFNGEIYNFRELRRELESDGHSFNTASDTEVILALFSAYGESMLHRLHGMFALVIWDRIAKRAFMARDPYGIKPLYYAQTSRGILVASQVKALLATGLVSKAPDTDGRAGFWMLGSVPEPHTWYRDIRALQGGHFAWLDSGVVSVPKCWFDIGEAWRSAVPSPLKPAEIADEVRSALLESVTRHLVADVPIGVFLSGGVDSGAVAGLMLQAGAQQLQGVTIAFAEFDGSPQDEAPLAARTAAHYDMGHKVRRVTRQEMFTDLPRIIDAMDQPSIDGINTWFASKAVAERGLKVVVSGIGGDELFQGYSSFRELPRLVKGRRALSRIPGAVAVLQRLSNLQAQRTRNDRWRHLPDWSRSVAGAWWLRRSLNSPEQLQELMGGESAQDAIRQFNAEACVARMSGALPRDARLAVGQIESTTYLRNQLLRDSDWASMDHSVELRTPLVDAHLLMRLQPFLAAFSRFPKKSLLALAPKKALPEEVTSRPKTGFGIPLGSWLGGQPSGRFEQNSRSWAKEIVVRYEASVP